MTMMRAFGLALIVTGTALGTMADDVAPRQIPQAAGYFVLAGDFHVHSFLGEGCWRRGSIRARPRVEAST